MKKIEAALSRSQCYRDWHSDHRTVYLSWAMVAATAAIALNIMAFSTELAAYQGDQAMTSAAMRKTPAPAVQDGPIETDRIIVKMNPDRLPPGLSVAALHANLEKAHGLNRLLTIAGIDAVVYQVSGNDTAREVVDRLRAQEGDRLLYAEVDMLVPPSMIPNDPNYPNAWHHPKIGTPEAWDMTQGEGVVVAILDSGVDCTHPDLAASCVNGWNFFENNSNTDDVYGHGTKVAGAAMAIGNNAVGVAGVAPKTKVMPIRIAGTDGYGSVTAMLQGMTYAADHGARVANLSFGYICGYQSLLNAANYMRGKGGVATFAAGNYNSDDGSAPSTSVTCVSATGSTDVKASWSSFGNAVDVATPGVGIQTTVKGGSYGSVSGTSIASPVTAGIYALMFSVNPKLTPAEADSILFQTADDLGTVGWDMYYGHGRVNAARAVALAASTTGSLGDIDRTAPSTPVNLAATAITGTSVTLTWSPSTDNVAVTGYNVYRNGVKIGTSASTLYTDTTVKGDTTYTYAVAAYDKEVNISAQSSSVTVVTPSAPLAIVSSSVSVKGATSAAITVATSKAATVTVRYGTTATNLSLSMTGSGAATSQTLTLTGLKRKTKYFYQVVATTGTETATGAVSNFRTAAK